MSLKAGGGNLGTIFSTLTYSDMMAVFGGESFVCEGCCSCFKDESYVGKNTSSAAAAVRARNCANGLLRNSTG